MKKILLSSAMALLAVGAFAQNSSDIDQMGTNNADVVQVSTGIFVNTSLVTQDGTTNDAQVNQEGQNASTVTQTGLSNLADINQVGGNQPINYDDVNTSLATQTGNDNVIDVDQVAASGNAASANDSEIIQDNSLTGGDGNYAKVLQGAFANDSYALQLGDDNSVDVDQAGAAHVSTSFQSSDGAVGTTVGAGYAQTSDVYQRGRRNFSSVSQIGDINSSTIDQQSTASFAVAGLESNNATISQNGYFNTSTLMQSDLLGNDGNNAMTVTQTNLSTTGPGNLANGVQQGANTATVTQTNF